MSEEERVKPSVESGYVAPAPAGSRKRSFWIVGLSAAVVLVAGITTAVALRSSRNSEKTNTMTLDSVVDTAPITEPNSTTTEVPTTATADSTIPDTSVAASDSLVTTTTPMVTGSHVPQSKPLRLSIRLDSALNTSAPGAIFTYTITIENPGEVDKPIRITAGYQQNGAVKSIAGVRVSGCPGWRGGANGIYLGIDGATLPAASVCTVSFDVATNPSYQGDLRTVAGLYDDYDRTEKVVTAQTVFMFFPEATTTTVTIPDSTTSSTSP